MIKLNKYNIYGIYKNIRNSSWQCLIDYGINTLPVDLLAITKAANIKLKKNSDVYELSPTERGASIYDDEEQQWYIVYDDEDILVKRRIAIAHELGHIFLGHEVKARKINSMDSKAERDADMFALRLLAPACVLWALDLHTKEEIANICNICNTSAKDRESRMAVLYKRNKFLTDPLEQRLYVQFEDFIDKNKK